MIQATTVYQVSDLVNEMKRLLEASYPEVWIEGELSSLSTPASGHLYFSLKDEQTQLRCAMFRNRASLSRYKPKAGDLVRVRARISVYPARGDLQCIVQHIEDAGEGVLQRRFEELKTQLQKEGLFANEHKQAIPSLPRHIGLITSRTGAAVKDILSTLERRCPGIPVTLYPALVQGETAAQTIVDALANAVQHDQCDVLIVARGGGSLEDLWSFNDERLARAVFQCPLPIVSAVGHEVDVSICDFVADLRAPTPTAAAELLSPDNQALLRQLTSLHQRLGQSTERYLQKRSQQVDMVYRRLQHPSISIARSRKDLEVSIRRLHQAMRTRLAGRQQAWRTTSQRMQQLRPDQLISRQQNQLGQLAHRLHLSQANSLTSKQQHFKGLGEQLHLVSPLATLERGFSISRDEQGAILRDSSTTKPGESISIELKKGKLRAQVTDVTK
ncbi:MAG: exodeoxyribonuclease VII large subunit [Pseudomonadota bacterium]